MPLTANRLWVVATPLGNPGDLSPRAREVLAAVDLVLAEDTRRAARLLRACDVHVRRLWSFFEHNEAERQDAVLRLLRAGQAVALISDAGTPLLADPGYRLVRACRREGLQVSPVPGPSAPVTALSAAGLPPLPYSFLGFLPRDDAGRDALFRAFAQVPGSLVFFERRDRLGESLARAAAILGPREAAVCRELTKEHEEFILLNLGDAATLPQGLLGEITVIVGPGQAPVRTPEALVRQLARDARARGGTAREVARTVRAAVRGWSGKEIYALLAGSGDGGEGEDAEPVARSDAGGL